MITTVRSYAELCLEMQRLKKENEDLKLRNRELKKSNRLVFTVIGENLELSKLVNTQKTWIAYLEARLRRNAKGIHN